MRDVGFIEKYGSGIYFMSDVCRDYGIPEPKFELSALETKLIFRSAGESVIVSEIEKLDVELNKRQKNALKFIA
jgi:ATP-dependent DNA helicase RecG